MTTSQVWRFPKKYWELFKNISNEDTWIIIKEIFFWDWNNLTWLNKAYYDIIKVDLENLEKSAMNWKKWWRPKKEETPGYENKKPQVMKNNNLKEREREKEREKNIYSWASRSEVLEELHTITKWWNETWNEQRQVTQALQEVYLKVRKKYTKEEIRQSLKVYHEEKKDTERQYRLDPIRFFSQKNGFITYL